MKYALALLWWSTIAIADTPGDVTADQAVALYRAHSPRLAADRAAIAVTAADLEDAHVYPNPTLSIGTTNTVQGVDTIGHSQESVGLEIPLLIGGQRGHRADAASARIAARRADVDADQARAELEIRRRFVTLLAAQQKVDALAAALDDARALRVIVAGRQQAGAKSPYELERTDLALAALASRHDEATTDAAAAAAGLAQAVGLPTWQPHAVGTFRPSDPAQSALAATHPSLIAAAAARSAARAEQALARSEAIPTPSLQLQGFGTTDPQGLAITVGVSLPLPLFDRNQGARARARASLRAADLDQLATTSELSADLTRTNAIASARRAAVTRFESSAVDRLPQIRTMAEASYRAGQGNIVDLLDALDAITDARLRDIDLIAASLSSELDVRAAALGR